MFTLTQHAMRSVFGCGKQNRVHPVSAAGAGAVEVGVNKFVVIGLDGSGKSTILASLQRKPMTKIAPTWGCNTSDPVKVDRRKMMLYDLGGSERIRDIWPEYYAESHGFIFVVDAGDPGRFAEAADALQRARAHPYLAGKPFLVLCNKAATAAAKTDDAAVDAVIAGLQLDPQEQVAHVFRAIACDAIRRRRRRRPNKCIKLGLRWLVGAVMASSSVLVERMAQDMAEYKEHVDRERREKQERVRRTREERERRRLAEEAEAKADVDAGNVPEGPSVEGCPVEMPSIPGSSES